MSTNPFDNTRVSRRSASRGGTGEPAIWAARNVEWPLPSTLSNSQYARLLKASKQAAQSLGMTIPVDTRYHAVVSALDSSSGPASNADAMSTTSSSHQHGAYYAGGLSGFMSRVLNVSHPSDAASDMADYHTHPESDTAVGSGNRPLRPPRPGCVAAANGWIIACLECPNTPNAGTIGNASNNQASTGLPPLRLVSRWNVRRGHGGSLPDQWMVLPPPVRPVSAKILHVLVDPTASHSLFSASNGECYYIHHSNTSKQPIKLHGFGPNIDGRWPKETLTGLTATDLQGRTVPPTSPGVQQGISVGSYVTSVAWDRERGTEGSSKRILLGTSVGEIYEYALISPASEDKEDVLPLPVLLHKLYNTDSADPSELGAAVTGLHFERLRTGILVLAATSGRHKRTRVYTFYSPHNSSLQMVMADQQYATLTELPGSIDFTDLKLCGDHFGLLSASGIYYGTIDRSLSSVNSQSSVSSVKMIINSGILPYSSEEGKGSKAAVPVSLAITPHHLITLSETNEVMFINRVAQKVIQHERLDASLRPTTSTGLDESQLGIGELLMDSRRPEQVWLRRGKGLTHISSSQEDRDVWKYTLQKCLDMPLRSRTLEGGAVEGEKSKQRQIQELERRAKLLGSPVDQLSEDERAVETLFDQAKAQSTNAAQKAVVTAIRAEYHLHHGRPELAAKYFAQCPSSIEPFASTAVRLGLSALGVDSLPKSRGVQSCERTNIPLITYLSDKMRLSAINGDNLTSTMIGAWLTELYLNERENVLAVSTGDKSVVKDIDNALRAQFSRFLNSNVNHMDSSTIMKILASHDVEGIECAAFAAKSGDISTAVNAALCVSFDLAHGVYEALQILDDAPFELAETQYYKHAPLFLARAPSLACESFTRRYPQGLSPLKLLPALIKYEDAREEQARRISVGAQTSRQTSLAEESKKKVIDVQSTGTPDGIEMRVQEDIPRAGSFEDDRHAVPRYLEGIVKLGCQNSAVYSYLISLYARLEDEEPLYSFLSIHVSDEGGANGVKDRAGRQIGSQESPLDMPFALRTVLKSGRHFRSAILLYKGFGMRQEAVELALKVDPALARKLAQESVVLEERKRLWLMIAKHAAADPSCRAGKDVVARVVSLLRDCGPDVLSIEDVLPYMPDFASISQLKDEICEALESYSSKINGFMKEMSDCDEACEDLRAEIRRLRNYRMRMMPDARCAYSNKLVLQADEPFYIFPSGFVVLNSALKKEVVPFLNTKQKERVLQLESLISSTTKSNSSSEVVGNLQAELDGLIAAECPLTGSIMIESIDQDFDNVTEIWEK